MNRALLVANVQGLSNKLILLKSNIFVIFEYDSTQLFPLKLVAMDMAARCPTSS